MQSFRVPVNSTPVEKVRNIVNPSSSTSLCRRDDNRLLQVIIMREDLLNNCIESKLKQCKNRCNLFFNQISIKLNNKSF